MSHNQQKGFTLIELIVVIAILGILAATALPRFVDLSGDADRAALDGFAGAINSGNNINYAAHLAKNTQTVNTTAGCTLAVANSLLQQAMPSGYDVEPTTASETGTLALGTPRNCTLSKGSNTAGFVITGAQP